MDNQEKLKEEKSKLADLEAMIQYEGEDRIITSDEAWRDLEEERIKPKVRFMSKIPRLDQMTDGFRKGDVIVISGLTKQGKTSLAQTFTTNFAEQDIPCLWFSYEMMPLEFLEKLNVPLPFFTMPRRLKGNTLKWIEERIVESIAKYGTKIVFIDHLHFLLDMSFIGQSKGNVSLLLGGIMREFKKIALYREITIFLIAHTIKVKFEQEPELSDIRDSSFISQEADTVLIIERKKEKGRMTENQAWLGVLANRRTGKVGKIDLIFSGNKFFEEEYKYGENNN